MSTLKISLSEELRNFVAHQASKQGYDTSNEYVLQLIHRERDRVQLRDLLMEGASSLPSKPVDTPYFEGLRRTILNE